jgi:hypothetical protein
MEAGGIVQSDLLIRTAILEGFRDIRANQWKLDYIFRGLLDDALTSKEYGKKQIDAAKKWLINTDIAVFISAQQGQVRFPCITIDLVESGEGDNTLGDVHSTTTEELNDPWPALGGPFDPVSWNAATGELTLPPSVLDSTDVFPDMNVVDALGVAHPILDVRSNSSTSLTVIVAANTAADFRGAVIKAKSPATVLTLESVWCRESYRLGCHIEGEPLMLTFLHSALVFILLHFRQDLFEVRGFEIGSISSTDFARNQNREEPTWSRYVTLTGKVQQVWPKLRTTKIAGVNPAIRIMGAGHLPGGMDPDEFAWLGDVDKLNSKWR